VPKRHAARRAALSALLAERDLDAALVTRLVNVRYLTGLASSNAALLVTAAGDAVLATDGRYATAAAASADDVELVVERAVGPALVQRATAERLRVAVEDHDVTLALADALREAAGLGAGTELDRLGRAVEQLRTVKDDEELGALERACAISSAALAEVLDGPLLGRTERDVARDLEGRMQDLGADGIAFDTIVATGPDSAVPHHRAGPREIARGDLLKIDFGAQIDGYHADCTRTVVVGTAPAAWQHEVHDLVREAQRVGRDALAPDAACAEVDAAARTVIADAGHAEHFTHGLGHGVGLEIHEAPSLAATATGRLADRVPVTVEPGVYLPGRGGVRIEDTLVVRDAAAGGTVALTTAPRELLVVGG
jgi:Xaa-Pro aminopeptidase